ncbi:hypothetical protein ACU686_06115 [Yinghuangia aomiensis]
MSKIKRMTAAAVATGALTVGALAAASPAMAGGPGIGQLRLQPVREPGQGDVQPPDRREPEHRRLPRLRHPGPDHHHEQDRRRLRWPDCFSRRTGPLQRHCSLWRLGFAGFCAGHDRPDRDLRQHGREHHLHPHPGQPGRQLAGLIRGHST